MSARGRAPEVCRARASDRAAITDFCARLYPDGDYVLDTLDSWMLEKSLRVVRAGGRAAGACSVSVRGDEAWLEGLRVDPLLHGRGFGSALVESAVSEARSRGARTVRMFAEKGNSVSLRLAERAGFRIADAWTWYALRGEGRRPEPAPPRPLRGLALDSWRAYTGAGSPLFLEGAACALAPSKHFAGTLLVTVVEASDLGGLAGYLRSISGEWPARRMSGWTSGMHVASALGSGPFRGLFEPVARFEMLARDL